MTASDKLTRLCAFVALAASVLQGCTILVHPPRMPPEASRIDFSDPVLNQRRVFVVGEITESSAAQVIRQLWFLDAQGHSPIELYLMTAGGDLKAAFAIVHTMRLVTSRIHTYAIGECNSSGTVILAAGTGKRHAFDDTTLVIHGMEAKKDTPTRYINLTQESYTRFWRQHARLPETWLPIPPRQLHFLSAQESLEFGLVDRVLKAAEPAGAATGSRLIRSETNTTRSSALTPR